MDVLIEDFEVCRSDRPGAVGDRTSDDQERQHAGGGLRGRSGAMRSDQTKLRQSLFNLLSNAAKFTERGRITLGVERIVHDRTDAVEFKVSDTGIGDDGERAWPVVPGVRAGRRPRPRAIIAEPGWA